MYHNKLNYPLFTVMDKVQVFKGNHSRTGLYYVEGISTSYDIEDAFVGTKHIHETQTLQYFPLRGNGWYSEAMISYCLETNIITEANIKQVIYSSLEVKHDYFNKLINHLYSELNQYNTDDFKFDKFAVNSMIGSFKPKLKETWKSIAINDNANNLFHHYLKNNNSKIDVMDIEIVDDSLKINNYVDEIVDEYQPYIAKLHVNTSEDDAWDAMHPVLISENLTTQPTTNIKQKQTPTKEHKSTTIAKPSPNDKNTCFKQHVHKSRNKTIFSFI